ncbi:MAG TPA: hypothetical protein VJR89_05910, partial [Polyangiales bacterium]|nr:hypothetical protein [Polyangiales bacterium]
MSMRTEDFQFLQKDASAAAATSFSPDQIRSLRGKLSRAAFARRLHVTALTVYRWELPETAEEARRPRGRVLQRLKAYASAPLRAASE